MKISSRIRGTDYTVYIEPDLVKAVNTCFAILQKYPIGIGIAVSTPNGEVINGRPDEVMHILQARLYNTCKAEGFEGLSKYEEH